MLGIIGPVVTFTMRWADGSLIGFSEVGRLAAERNIQLRTGTFIGGLFPFTLSFSTRTYGWGFVCMVYTGCFCNVGGCQEALGQSARDVEYNYSIGRVCSEAGHDVVNGKHTGIDMNELIVLVLRCSFVFVFIFCVYFYSTIVLKQVPCE